MYVEKSMAAQARIALRVLFDGNTMEGFHLSRSFTKDGSPLREVVFPSGDGKNHLRMMEQNPNKTTGKTAPLAISGWKIGWVIPPVERKGKIVWGKISWCCYQAPESSDICVGDYNDLARAANLK